MRKKLAQLALFSIIFIYVAPTVYAAQSSSTPLQYAPLEPLPGVYQINSSGYFTGNIPSLINGFFKLLLSLGSVFAVVMIVIYGITYMTSEVAGNKAAARGRVQAALLGLLLLLGAWIILNTINPNLLNVSLNIPSLSSSTTKPSSPDLSSQICGNTICANGNNNAINIAVNTWNNQGCPLLGNLLCTFTINSCFEFSTAYREGIQNEYACGHYFPHAYMAKSSCEQIGSKVPSGYTCLDVPYFNWAKTATGAVLCGTTDLSMFLGPQTGSCEYPNNSQSGGSGN